MGCEHKEGGAFYHPRQPQQTPFDDGLKRLGDQELTLDLLGSASMLLSEVKSVLLAI